MKAIVLSSLLACASAAVLGAHHLGYINCGEVCDSVVPMLQRAELIDQDPRHVVIGLDITAGREGELDKDRQAISRMINDASLGDRIEVFLIHSRAESEQEAVFMAQMPKNQGPAGQEFARARQKAEADWEACWNTRVIPVLRDTNKKQQTDLFGFLRFVTQQKQDFQKSLRPFLVLFTDGQQVGDGVNMEKMAPTTAQLKKLAEGDLLPDLTGITVSFAGVTPTHKISNAHWRKIQSFWLEFAKEAGAKAVTVTSDRVVKLET